jgi:hypothetical protein
MLATMIDGSMLWLLLVGVAVGVAVTAVLLVRLPRTDDDVSREERHSEAAWITRIIESNGGVAPVSLVEEVLDLHSAYLRASRLPPGTRLPSAPRPPVSAIVPPPPPGYAGPNQSLPLPPAPAWQPVPPTQPPPPPTSR